MVKNVMYFYSGIFSVIFVGIMFAQISQLNATDTEQFYSISSIKMISSETMSGMSGMNMSGMHGMSGMNMSGMHGILDMDSNEKISSFIEWMSVLIAGLIGIPFAWVIISQKRNSN